MPGYNVSTRVSRLVREAHDAALKLGSPAVTPEHILLALTSGDPATFRHLLDDLAIPEAPIEALRARLATRLKALPAPVGGPLELSLTPAATGLIASAMHEALTLDHDHVAAEHLLLAYLHDRASIARDDLREAGLTWEVVRPWVARRLGA